MRGAQYVLLQSNGHNYFFLYWAPFKKIGGKMTKFSVKCGKKYLVAIVDNEYFPRVIARRWRVEKRGNTYYVLAFDKETYAKTRKIRNVLLHRFVLKLKPGSKKEVDHFDGDGLNNQKSNLKICSHQENMQNMQRKNSRFRGITWVASKNRWLAQIKSNYKSYCLGYFAKKSAAISAATAARKQIFKNFNESRGKK